ncbi:unnamed protein product [Meganyctiphanes norvegica]|uniref:RGS domain-containing protein n=1 Tax=Meganyctiphanes norvegica TaxID=48144 RepID=A0AAV2SHN3_MEGNR
MVSREQRQKWKSSVTSLLSDPFGLQSFRDFLEKRKEESKIQVTINCVDFYEKCEHHKKLTKMDELKKSAKAIFDVYLDELAEKEIPAVGESKNSSKKIAEKLSKGELSIKELKKIFDDAQENVCQFITDGGYHKAFCKELKIGRKTTCTIY